MSFHENRNQIDEQRVPATDMSYLCITFEIKSPFNRIVSQVVGSLLTKIAPINELKQFFSTVVELNSVKLT